MMVMIIILTIVVAMIMTREIFGDYDGDENMKSILPIDKGAIK